MCLKGAPSPALSPKRQGEKGQGESLRDSASVHWTKPRESPDQTCRLIASDYTHEFHFTENKVARLCTGLNVGRPTVSRTDFGGGRFGITYRCAAPRPRVPSRATDAGKTDEREQGIQVRDSKERVVRRS